jgi:cytochrome c553
LRTASGNANPIAPANVATVRSDINAAVHQTDIGIRRDTASVEYRYTPTTAWDFKLNYSDMHRTGTQIDGVARSDDTMKGIASGLGAGAVRNMAAYYAGLEPQLPNVRKPATTEEWAQKCDRCHGINGNSADPRLPALAGQRTDYLERALRAFKSGERKSPQMAAMSAGLTEEDITNLAAYYAGQRARAAIFIIVPSK